MIDGWRRNSGGGAISVPTRKVRLDHLLQFSVNSVERLARITSELVRLGIHPFDEFGTEAVQPAALVACLQRDRGRGDVRRTRSPR